MMVLLVAISTLALATGFSTRTAARAVSSAPLAFSKNGSFQIAVFEDLHFGENYWEDWGPKQDVNTVLVINEVLDQETPQLAVLNGDLITGNNAFRENSTAVIDKLAVPFVQRGLPWASTYGNHDSDFNLSRADILRAEHKYPNARTTNMLPDDRSGVTNYYLPIYPSDGSLTTPSLILWFFDSRGGFYADRRDPTTGAPIPQPNWVDGPVVDWFLRTTAALTARNHGRPIPSLAFVHIPLNASRALQLSPAGVDPHRHPGINDDVPLAAQAQGWCADGVSDGTCAYGGQDGPFMKALAATPRLLAVFSGHDHGDSWCYPWRGGEETSPEVEGNVINLCFGQHSGYGGYGSWTRGARQILIHEADLAHDRLSTWIRLENSQVVGAVELNATYGRDIYPATPNTHS